jgi:formate--tetrahydrofolate ligase
VVATIRALKMHGGMAKDALKHENVEALRAGFANLARHIGNVGKFGVPVVVAVNRFSADTQTEVDTLLALCHELDTPCVMADHWAHGGAGAAALATKVVETIETKPANFRTLYPDDMKLADKVRTIATQLYGAADIALDAGAKSRLAELEKDAV